MALFRRNSILLIAILVIGCGLAVSSFQDEDSVGDEADDGGSSQGELRSGPTTSPQVKDGDSSGASTKYPDWLDENGKSKYVMRQHVEQRRRKKKQKNEAADADSGEPPQRFEMRNGVERGRQIKLPPPPPLTRNMPAGIKASEIPRFNLDPRADRNDGTEVRRSDSLKKKLITRKSNKVGGDSNNKSHNRAGRTSDMDDDSNIDSDYDDGKSRPRRGHAYHR